jgi:hypothetical protein
MEEIIHKLQHKEPTLTTLSEMIPWKPIRTLLEQG